MKIGFLLPTLFASKRLFPDRIFAPGDLARDTVNGLVEKGHEVFVFSTPDFETKGNLIPGDIRPFEAKLEYSKLQRVNDDEAKIRNDEVWKRSFELSVTAHAYQMARKDGFDVIHAYHDFLFTPHYFEDVTQVPTAYTLHDPLPPEKSFEFDEFNKFRAHRYVSISNSQRKSSLGLNFVDTVYHGLSVGSMPFEAKPSDYLLFMGRMVAEKGLEDAIQASILTNTHLKIGSRIPPENEKNAFFEEKIKPHLENPLILEPGFVNSKDKMALYGGAKALLFPILWDEPFGMVMIEAMACGTPVIAYNRGSVSEVVKDGVSGFIVPPEKGVTGLVEAIKKIDQIDRAACRRHVEENFSIEKIVDGYEKVYRAIQK